jgi:hypothetical protein
VLHVLVSSEPVVVRSLIHAASVALVLFDEFFRDLELRQEALPIGESVVLAPRVAVRKQGRVAELLLKLNEVKDCPLVLVDQARNAQFSVEISTVA